ncbi:MAG TPA: sulfotransferase, partial [Cryomorphaceae bacterium]|nr:sulfotransferase [Cryomorphaceae bacterium]
MKSPDFIHIGPGRTGTTYIFKMLGQHPGINLPNEKEINFFNRNYSKGL